MSRDGDDDIATARTQLGSPAEAAPSTTRDSEGAEALDTARTVLQESAAVPKKPAQIETARTEPALPGTESQEPSTILDGDQAPRDTGLVTHRVTTPPAATEEAENVSIPARPMEQTKPSRATSMRAFGPYSKVEVLAQQGSMGIVARGYNDEFGRWELLKFLRPELSAQPEIARQFKREGRVLAQLSHPNVVQVFATYELDGRSCLAMEFLQGESLEEHVEASGGKLSVERGLELMLETARGLAASHDVGLLHRDIKPENLFVTRAGRGRVEGLKLIDFGLATADKQRAHVLKDESLESDQMGGTPLFMAPELWLAQAASPRSDLYALGVTFYYAFCGRYPFAGLSLEEVRAAMFDEDPHPSVREKRIDLPQGLADLIDRLISKAPDQRPQNADDVVATLIGIGQASRPRKVPGAGPYRGLEPFTAAERDVFYGRDREIAEVTERLRTQAAVLLVGPSGSGKSSLARAGVLPAIEEGVLGGGIVFRSVAVTPRRRPLRSLASALAPLTPSGEDELHTFLRSEPERLGEALRSALVSGGGVVLLVDQLEELATQNVDPSEAQAFAVAIASIAETLSPVVRLVSTVRADLMDRLFTLEPLRGVLTGGFYPVRPLLGDALKGALTEPARAAGYELEDPSIADSIVEDVARTRAGLPLMSFAMAAWWRSRDEERKLLPTAAWEELGGLAGALSQHADSVLDSLGPEQRSAAEQILPRLVSAEGTRLRVAVSELTDPASVGPAGKAALAKLMGAKLVLEQGGEAELIHESLVKSWPTLGELLRASGEDRAIQQRVVDAARQWEAQERPDGALWDGEQATRLLAWFASTEVPLGQLELSFVEAVRSRVARRRGLARGALAVASVVILGIVVIILVRDRRLEQTLGKQTQVAEAATKQVKEDGARLNRVAAQALVRTHPVAALKHARRSRDHKSDPLLDPIGWQATMMGVPQALPRHDGGAAYFARFSPDGAWVVTAGQDKRLHWLEVSGPRTKRVVLPAAPTRLAFGESGLAAGFPSGEVKVLGFEGEKVSYKDCQGPVSELLWQKETLVAVCGPKDNGTVHFLGSGRPPLTSVRRYAAHEALSAFVTADELRIYRGAELHSEHEIDAASIGSLAVSELHEPQVLVGMTKGLVRGWLLAADTGGAPWLEHDGADVARLSISPDGKSRVSFARNRLPMSASAPTAATPFAARVGGRSGPLVHTAKPLLAWMPGRGLLALVGERQIRLVLTELPGGPQVLDKGIAIGDLQLTSLAVDPKERWLVGVGDDGSARAWDLSLVSPRLVRSGCRVQANVEGVLCQTEDQVRVGAFGDARAVQLPQGLPRPGARLLAQSGDERIWMVRDEGTTTLISSGPKKKLAVTQLPFEPVVTWVASNQRSVAFAGAGRALLVAAGAQRDCELDSSSKSNASSSGTYSLAFDEDGAELAVGGPSGVTLCDTVTGKRKRSIALADATALAFAPGGGKLAAGTEAGEVHLLEQEGEGLEPLLQLNHAVVCTAFSRDGRVLILGTRAGDIQLFDTETNHVVRLLNVQRRLRHCRRSPASDRFAFELEAGPSLVYNLDLRAVWMLPAPDEPLVDGGQVFERWSGIARKELGQAEP